MAKNIIIAIDGFSSSGKSTLAKDLAKKLNFTYIDSGAMYRAITLYCLNNNIINKEGNINKKKLIAELHKINIEFKKINGENHVFLNNVDVEKNIRNFEVSKYVSKISQIKKVREKLRILQQKMGESDSIVMDGRDITTVVFPNADVKFFVTAKAEIRAKRRYKELIKNNKNISFEEVLQNIKMRDKEDRERKINPLKIANDAIIIDNSNINRKEQLDYALKYIYKKIKND